LNEYTSGIWHDDPRAGEKMNAFFSKDIYSDPKYKNDAGQTMSRMKIRLDSRGGLVNRSMLGDKEVHKQIAERGQSQ